MSLHKGRGLLLKCPPKPVRGRPGRWWTQDKVLEEDYETVGLFPFCVQEVSGFTLPTLSCCALFLCHRPPNNGPARLRADIFKTVSQTK